MSVASFVLSVLSLGCLLFLVVREMQHGKPHDGLTRGDRRKQALATAAADYVLHHAPAAELADMAIQGAAAMEHLAKASGVKVGAAEARVLVQGALARAGRK